MASHLDSTPSTDTEPVASSAENASNVQVILIGVGGATCSGKTTLAKYLKRILLGSVIIHQDDFSPPMDHLPMHPILNVPDWDAAPSACDYPRLAAILRHVKESGQMPEEHVTFDHLNEHKNHPALEEEVAKWSQIFSEKLKHAEAKTGRKIVLGLVDGFLLYWCKEVRDQLDVRILLRTPVALLKERRGSPEKSVWHLQDGSIWLDPPGYWDNVIFPAYLDAHRAWYEGGDVVNGKLSKAAQDEKLALIEETEASDLVNQSCQVLLRKLERM